MANSYTVLADLKAERCANAAEIRLLRFWEAKNRNKNGQLMSLDMLLIDEQATVVLGSVPAALQQTFRSRLTEGSVYTLSGFDVTRSSPKYRLIDGPVSIRFNEGTDFRKLATTSRVIPTEHFRVRPFDQIRELANSGKQLPDVMGELRAIKSTITDRLPGAPRVMLTIRLDSDVDVCVIHDKFSAYGKEPKIVMVTSINPKMAAGRLYLNGTSATRLFFDCETAVGKDAYNRQVLIFPASNFKSDNYFLLFCLFSILIQLDKFSTPCHELDRCLFPRLFQHDHILQNPLLQLQAVFENSAA